MRKSTQVYLEMILYWCTIINTCNNVNYLRQYVTFVDIYSNCDKDVNEFILKLLLLFNHKYFVIHFKVVIVL